MPAETPLSSAEKNALIDFVKLVEIRSLAVKEVVCDGTATKQLNDINIRKQLWLRYMTRCLKRSVINTQLSNKTVCSSNSKLLLHITFRH